MTHIIKKVITFCFIVIQPPLFILFYITSIAQTFNSHSYLSALTLRELEIAFLLLNKQMANHNFELHFFISITFLSLICFPHLTSLLIILTIIYLTSCKITTSHPWHENLTYVSVHQTLDYSLMRRRKITRRYTHQLLFTI